MLTSTSNEAMRKQTPLNWSLGPLNSDVCKKYIKKKRAVAYCT